MTTTLANVSFSDKRPQFELYAYVWQYSFNAVYTPGESE